MHYFDVRMLIHDVNLVESDEPANLQNGFTRHFFVDQSSNNESDAPPPSCDNHYGASSSTATKRKATDDPSSSASMPQSGRRESRLDTQRPKNGENTDDLEFMTNYQGVSAYCLVSFFLRYSYFLAYYQIAPLVDIITDVIVYRATLTLESR
ncbi:hypothetical protein QWA68_010029 [Fusarium oxysporum]|nr:hypothetical protein QWA68_010029 [Fusarium oxysporum]